MKKQRKKNASHTAVTDEERSFLEVIAADLDDDAPRLVFADWLEEHGDPCGEFIRVQSWS